ncbi:Gfo/Idh/MocA family protein [Mycoplana dimorpha]|uniref:Putative dehydrogenase n=1 Tax=Mycoplana dimorpha TaxID=28320 RepID=A0A2T5BB04_MYCDI|nr:Gfo/Idh/MocA family oxidoreductase [Mycoplana dimorpha]PTM96149.1 putative dehydrogenase [Mycoplana dimorpha]
MSEPPASVGPARPRPLRLGFAGVGWIGRHRMKAMLETGLAEAVALCDPAPAMLEEALAIAPLATVVPTYGSMLEHGLDGIVIATPSALHAEQAIAALDTGHAVFCQKPLARSREETRPVIEAARRSDRLLAVDFCYRHTVGMQALRKLASDGSLGRIFAIDLTFHNAYGPDKDWFYDKARSGGGCVIDLGVHLVDLALWLLDFPQVVSVDSHLFHHSRPLPPGSDEIEDFAVATLGLESGAVARIACSWRLHAGRNAAIGATVYGSEGGGRFHNVDGSFYDFAAERFDGTNSVPLTSPPDDWGGRAAADWVHRVADGARFDERCLELEAVARVIDAIYGQ